MTIGTWEKRIGALSPADDFYDPACGGGEHHGRPSNLSIAELDALIAYLGTL